MGWIMDKKPEWFGLTIAQLEAQGAAGDGPVSSDPAEGRVGT